MAYWEEKWHNLSNAKACFVILFLIKNQRLCHLTAEFWCKKSWFFIPDLFPQTSMHWYKCNVQKKTVNLVVQMELFFFFFFYEMFHSPTLPILSSSSANRRRRPTYSRGVSGWISFMQQLFRSRDGAYLKHTHSSTRHVWTRAILVFLRSSDPTEAAHLQRQEHLRNKAAPQQTFHTALPAHLLHWTTCSVLQESIPSFAQSPTVAVSLWEPHWRAVLAVFMLSMPLAAWKVTNHVAYLQLCNHPTSKHFH